MIYELLEIELFDLCVNNDCCLIELFVIHINTWNLLAVYKRMSNVELSN